MALSKKEQQAIENHKKAVALCKELAVLSKTDKQKFLEVMKSESPAFYLLNLSETQLLKFPNVILRYIATGIGELADKYPKTFEEHDVFTLKKQAVLKICMSAPEISYSAMQELILNQNLTLAHIQKSFSEDSIKKLPATILDALQHPENMWKIAKNTSDVFELMPENVYAPLEYFAENNPQMFKSLLNAKVVDSPYSRKKLIEQYDSAEPSTIPASIQEYIEQSKTYLESQRQKALEVGKKTRQLHKEFRGKFVDKDGNFLTLFTLKSDLIKSKEDYYKIAEIFKESGLSVNAFCRKFGIKDVEGFREMLSRVAEQDPAFAEFYNEFTDKKTREFMLTSKKIITGVVGKTMGVEEAITTPLEAKNFEKLLEMAEYFFQDQGKTAGKFLNEVIAYYHARLNSYDELSIEPSEIQKRLSAPEVLFLMNKQAIASIRNGKSCNLYALLYNQVMNLRGSISPESFTMFHNKKDGLYSKLGQYSSLFDRYSYVNESRNSNVQIILSDGSQTTVNDEVIDMAECFASKHGLFKSSGTMNKLIRAALEGKLNNKQQTEEYKESLKQQIKRHLKECKTLEEYFLTYQNNPNDFIF